MVHIAKNSASNYYYAQQNKEIPLWKTHYSITINDFKDEAEMIFWYNIISTMIEFRKKVDKEKSGSMLNEKTC